MVVGKEGYGVYEVDGGTVELACPRGVTTWCDTEELM